MGSTFSKKGELADQSEMEADPDMIAERLDTAATIGGSIGKGAGGGAAAAAAGGGGGGGGGGAGSAFTDVRLNVISSSHHPNEDTRRLLREVGGLPALRRMYVSPCVL